MSLYVAETGTHGAPTIVFLHAIGTSEWMWRPQVEHLRDYHCLVPHLPGHGQSTHVPWISLADTAEQVAAIIRERATNGTAHLVGLSLGAYIVAHMLSDHAEVIDHAIMSGVTVFPLPFPGIMKLMGRVTAPLMKTKIMARVNAKALRVPVEYYAEYYEGLQAMAQPAFLRASAEAGRFTLPPGLAQVSCPTLVVAGQREHPLILRSAKAVVETMPNAQVRIAPNGGHGWNGEAPQLFNAMIRAWLTNSPLPQALLPLSA